MEQFSLEKYLENPSRKVVTRRGNSVRIICWDRKHGADDLPIVFLEENNVGECLWTCKSDGRCDNYDTQYDLFFADEEDEFTEFEKVLKEVIEDVQNGDYIEEESFDFWKDKLLDLARKEILKDLPKWKKMPSGIQGNNKLEPTYLIRTDYGFYFTSSCLSESENNMYIELVELEKLPKEE